MPSLSEAYGGRVRGVVSRRRRLLAVVFFAAGVTMGATAILLTTTGLRSWAGLDVVEAGLLAETVRLRGSGRRRNEYSLRVETVGLSLNPDGIDVTVSGRSRRAHRRSG